MSKTPRMTPKPAGGPQKSPRKVYYATVIRALPYAWDRGHEDGRIDYATFVDAFHEALAEAPDA